jgi:hypothetical protein
MNDCKNQPGPLQPQECKEIPPAVENLKIEMHAGPGGIQIKFSSPVSMVGFTKDEALQLGQLIIQTALKL